MSVEPEGAANEGPESSKNASRRQAAPDVSSSLDVLVIAFEAPLIPFVCCKTTCRRAAPARFLCGLCLFRARRMTLQECQFLQPDAMIAPRGARRKRAPDARRPQSRGKPDGASAGLAGCRAYSIHSHEALPGFRSGDQRAPASFPGGPRHSCTPHPSPSRNPGRAFHETR